MKQKKTGCPIKFSVCIIALNEAEYIEYALKQVYGWKGCYEIIIVEGSVDLYPKFHLSSDGLSNDGTTQIIKNYPDPEGKIIYISGRFKDKVVQRNEYAKRVTGTHVLVLDADEFYTLEDLDNLYEDVNENPEAGLFTFDFSSNLNNRTYFHLWHGFQQHVVGGYWNVPHHRIYKWTPGTVYKDEDHNHPVTPDGNKLYVMNSNLNILKTRAKCFHAGFSKKNSNQKDKNDYYVARGEGKEKDMYWRERRQMYVDCRKSCESWHEGKELPYGAKVLPLDQKLPEALLNHPYFSNFEL